MLGLRNLVTSHLPRLPRTSYDPNLEYWYLIFGSSRGYKDESSMVTRGYKGHCAHQPCLRSLAGSYAWTTGTLEVTVEGWERGHCCISTAGAYHSYNAFFLLGSRYNARKPENHRSTP